MPAPTIPIEIWAEGNVILPNTHELNKSRPINDLWLKGWDLGEEPTCEEFNYVLNMVTQWTKYVSGEQIPNLDTRYLRRSLNLSDLDNKATARTSLDVFSKGESDTRFVNATGDTMTGTLNVPMIKFPSDSSDTAYITSTVGDDITHLDICIGDNPQDTGPTLLDTIRFIFKPNAGTSFTLMEVYAASGAYAAVNIAGNLTVKGINADFISVPNIQATNATISNNLTVGTVQSTTTNAANMNVSNNVATANISVSTTATVTNLTVNSNAAVVAGRNIVRGVNGYLANGAGELTLPLPDPGVTDVRLGSQSLFNPGGNEISWTFTCPTGCMLTGIIVQDVGNNSADNIGGVYYRPVQKFLNGSWLTVGSL